MTSKKNMRAIPRGFTLIELLVVIAIIGILMGLVVPKLIQMMGSSREHKCRNNLRQLQAAVMNFVTDAGGHNTYLPNAMSYETYDFGSDTYHERRGWVGWVHKDDLGSTGVRYGKWWPAARDVGPVENDMLQGLGMGLMEKICIENGVLYTYMNNEISQYACPVIKRDIGGKMPVYRTYAMNVFFRSPMNPVYPDYGRWFKRVGTAEWEDFLHDGGRNNPSYCPEPAKVLLFAEVEPEVNPAGGRPIVTHPKDKSPGRQHEHADASRYVNDAGITRFIGDCCFNPPSSNTQLSGGDSIFSTHKGPTPFTRIGLAVFLDGHIESIVATADKQGGNYRDGNNGTKNYATMGAKGSGRFSAAAQRTDDKGQPTGSKYNVGWYFVRGIDPLTDVNN